MSDPAELIAEAAKAPIERRLLAWAALLLAGALVTVVVWFVVRMDDHMEKHDGQLTDIRVSIETVKGQVEKVDGKVTANNVATNSRMDGMQGMIQRVFDAEFPTLQDANKAREYLDEHSAPPRRKHRRSASAYPSALTVSLRC